MNINAFAALYNFVVKANMIAYIMHSGLLVPQFRKGTYKFSSSFVDVVAVFSTHLCLKSENEYF